MKMGAHIISTRILQDGLIRQLEVASLHVKHFDFIKKNIHIADEMLCRAVQDFVILTSVTAVQAWMEIAQKVGLDVLKHRIFCLEQATQSEVLKYHLPIEGVARDAASLADIILSNQHIRAVTFICSNLRRDELPSRLRDHGVFVDEWLGYITDLTPLKVEKPYDGLLFFSPSAIDSFLLVNPVSESVCFCIGKTTAEHAKQCGFIQVYTSETPSSESLVKAVINYYMKYPVHA